MAQVMMTGNNNRPHYTPSPATLAEVNRLIQTGITPENAYALGIVCALAWLNGREPSGVLLESAATLRLTGAANMFTYCAAIGASHVIR